jgi:hypothetical protein
MNLKRVWLREPTDPPHLADGSLFVRPAIVYAASLALATYATDGDAGRVEGDDVYEAVTEGRQSGNSSRRARGSTELPYSSCGDLVHWTLARLGIADEQLVNRNDDFGSTPWRSGVNIGRIFNHHAFRTSAPPPAGAPFFVQPPEHVEILQEWDAEGRRLVAAAYGQFSRQRGKFSGERKVRTLAQRGRQWMVGDRIYVGHLDLAALRYMRFAEVPADFEGGTPVD